MKNFFRKIQTIFKVTRSEIHVSIVLLIGLTIGLVANNFRNERTNNIIISENLFDSLNNIQQEINKSFYSPRFSSQNNFNEKSNSDNDSNEVLQSNYIAQSSNQARSKKLVSGSQKKIDLNLASKNDLMLLPGISEKTADAIIEWRKTKKFKKPSDILNIKGIGPAKFDKMKEFININKISEK
jgi:DNA uptake protein ComE-like DNA-binding protein